MILMCATDLSFIKSSSYVAEIGLLPSSMFSGNQIELLICWLTMAMALGLGFTPFVFILLISGARFLATVSGFLFPV
ncbi:hypothetical protein LINPERHAP1_LOCUS29162 [Linum perenne]